ncbi:MAG: MmgE/PrpD family protein [Alphaproteobacteria bacterium]
MATNNAAEISQFVGSAVGRNYPEAVIEAAKKCLVDWTGVALGARNEPAAKAVRTVAGNWGTNGDAQVMLGGTMAPAAAALINGTMAHCLDFDDTHVGAVTHISGPTVAAALAVGTHLGSSEADLLSALITGFEVAAHLGYGAGQGANMRGFHATGIFGAFGATAAAAVLYGLDAAAIRNAFGAVATQTGGLSASFGTMSKPFHAGKAAMNGVLSAELAAAGFVANENLVEPGEGLSAAIFQDGGGALAEVDFSRAWEITQNTFKPYAACLLTHAIIDGARRLSGQVQGREVTRIQAFVGEPAIKLANKSDPQTPLEGKFSLAFCVALGLKGFEASEADFAPDRLSDPAIRHLIDCVKTVPTVDMADTASRIVVELAGGEQLEANVSLALGNPGNPMSWDDMWRKFDPLARPALGAETEPLYALLRDFEEIGSLARFVDSVGQTEEI